MARQGNTGDNISMTASVDEQSLAGSLQNSKVYTSVSKMKREKLQSQKPTKSTTDLDFEPDSFQLVAPLKSFNSNPNLMPSESELVKMRIDNGQIYANSIGEYCRTQPMVPMLQKKKVNRPKTPPPPPPLEITRRESESDFKMTNRGKSLDRPRSTNSLTRPIKTNGTLSVYYNKTPLTPPPYDPANDCSSRSGNDSINARNGCDNIVSRNGINRNSTDTKNDNDWNSDDVTRIQVHSPNDDMQNGNSHRLCIQVKSRSMTPESLSKMSPADPAGNRYNNFSCPSIDNSNNNFVSTEEKVKSKSDYDFNTDLQNALTKRRMQMNVNSNGTSTMERQKSSPKFIPEPGGFTKKDSGYASSRNSLERNDFREELLLQRNGYANESAHRDFFIPQRVPLENDQMDHNFSSKDGERRFAPLMQHW